MTTYKKYIGYFGCAGLITLTIILCVAPTLLFGYLALYPTVAEYFLVRSFPIYPDSKRVHDDIGYYGADTSEKVIYYWTSDSLTDVQEYYGDVQFTRLEDEYGAWQTAFISSEMQQGDSLRCHYQQRYDCVTISFLSTENPEWYRTATVAPCCFRLQEPPDADIPAYGTLIIFHFYISGYYQ